MQKAERRKILGITCKDRKRTSWIREQISVEDILATIKKKSGLGKAMLCRSDDRRTTKVAEWQPANCRSQGRQRTRWRDETRTFAGAGWGTLTSDKENLRVLVEAFVLLWIS